MKFLQLEEKIKKELIKNLVVVIVCITASTALSFFFVTPKFPAPASQANNNAECDALSGSAKTSIFTINNNDFIADIVEEISPSIVHITTEIERSVASVPNAPSQFFFEEEFFKHFLGFEPFESHFSRPPVSRKTSGTGSGTIISEDGYILTNYHVVQNAKKIIVKVKDDKEFEAKLIGKDNYSDLAVIKIDQKGLIPAKISDSTKIRPGQWAIAVGSPHGLDHTVTLGIISAVSREIPELSNVSFIQTDAAINPGNSGGPLLNINGEVVGINTAIMGTAQNIGFAIPVNIAKQILEQLKSGETIGHPWLGVAMSPLTEELAKAIGIPSNVKGVVISRVIPDSPAEKNGLMQGDIIQRIDGQKFVEPKDIQSEIKKKKVGDSINIQVLRDGAMVAKKVKLGNWETN